MRRAIHEARHHFHRQAAHGAAHHRREDHRIVDIAGAERRNRDVGVHADQLEVEALVAEKAPLVPYSSGQKRHVDGRHRQPDFFRGL